MDLTAALLRFTARVPHVLTIAVPGRPHVRMDLEEALRRRGWPEATGPADADVLVVAGSAGPELREVVETLWRQIPAPRVRVELDDDATPVDLEDTLATIPPRLADAREVRRDAAAAAASELTDTGVTEAGVTDDAAHGDEHDHGTGERTGHTDHDQHTPESSGAADESEHGARGEHDAGNDAGHGEHGGGHHDHHMDMALPGGLAMADVADDRDGLTLDVLHLPLGPVLPEWPAGLVVDVELQGDVIVSATARVLAAGGRTSAAEPRTLAPAGMPAAVRDLDALARTLAVAGWPGPATRARVLRDRVRRGEPMDDLARLARTVRRSRVLRVMLRGTASGARGDVGVDVRDLLEQRLVRIEARAAGVSVDDPVRPIPVDLGKRLAGAELAAARLLVAALDPDVDGAVAAAAVPGPGEEGR